MVKLQNKMFISFLILLLAISLATALAVSCPASTRSRQDVIDFEVEILLEDQSNQDNLTLTPGEHYVAAVELTNIGTVNDTYNLSITGIPADWEVTFDNYKTKKSVSLTSDLYPDSYTKIMMAIKIPETAKKNETGKLSVNVESDAGITGGNPVQKSDSVTVVIDFIPPYLLLETQDDLKYVYPTETAEFEVTITNVGYDTILYTPQAASNGGTEWTVTITPEDEFYIGPGQSKPLEVKLTAPPNAPAGSKYSVMVKGTVSDDEIIIFPIEVNVFVDQFFNVSIDQPETADFEFPDISRSYPIVIKNNGNGHDKIELTVTSSPPATGVRLSNKVIMIGGGVYENITLMITPGIDTPMGTHELGIEAYRVRDTNTKELLEKFIVNVEIKYRPDLVINYDDLVLSKTTPIEYEQIYINATIYNLGDASAKNVTVTITPQAKGGSLLNPIGTQTIPDLAPQSSTTIGFTWEVDPSVEFIIVNIDPEDEYVEISESNNDISKNLFVIHEPTQLDVEQDGTGISYVTWGVSIIVTAVIVAAIAASASVVSTEYGKYAALKMLIPLYSRVKREDVLNHEVREQVYDYVKEHPGDHFRSILTHLELTNGTLVHHLNTLEKKDFIRSERDGPYKRFYPIGTKISGEVLEINGLQGKILDVAAARPGITQKGLAIKLGASTPTINYHVKALRNSGLLKVKRDGKVTRCYVDEMIKVKGKGAS